MTADRRPAAPNAPDAKPPSGAPSRDRRARNRARDRDRAGTNANAAAAATSTKASRTRASNTRAPTNTVRSAPAVPIAKAVPTFAALSPQGWLQMLLSPGAFFADPARLRVMPQLLLAVGGVGFAFAIGAIEWAMVGGAGSGSEVIRRAVVWLAAGWTRYWFIVLLAGSLLGAAAWWLGGALFHWRVRLCESNVSTDAADRADVRAESRAVFIYHALVIAVPVVTLALVQTIAFGNRAAAGTAASTAFAVLAGVLTAWSCATAYLAARSAFTVKRTPALAWFAALPAVLIAAVVGLAVGLR